jgi:multidrug efflux pump subunit AcrB
MTIAVSAIVSLTLTPMMASRLLKDQHHARHGRLYSLIERFFDRLLAGYMSMLDLVLRHRFITLMTFFGTVALSAYLFVLIPKGFFPNQDTGFIIGTTEAAQDVSFAEMARIQKIFGELVLRDPAVDTVGMSIGTGGGASGTNSGRMFITLKPRDERDVTADQFIARVRRQASKVQGGALYLQNAQDITVGGRTSRTQYQYTLTDADLNELNEFSPKILGALRKVPQLQDVASDQQTEGTTLTLTIDRDQAARFGIDPQLIDDTLYDAFGQRQVTQYFTQLNSYHVVLEILPELQEDPETLNRLYLKSPLTNQQIPLATFVHWTTQKVRPLSISHQGQFPATTISFNLAPNVSLGQATQAVDRVMADLKVPASLTGAFQGNAAAFQDSLKSEPYLIAAALIVIYIILGVLYESTIHPLTILSTLPSAGLGAVATLMLFGFDFSLIALIGVILLIGIVKKNGIMLVDFAIHAERDHDATPEESIREACRLRFRPIMMTTMAAILGGVPLMLGNGTGSELRQPLGYAMVGGLIVSQALTLFTTPVVYLYLDRLSNWLQGTKHGAETQPAGADERVRTAA